MHEGRHTGTAAEVGQEPVLQRRDGHCTRINGADLKRVVFVAVRPYLRVRGMAPARVNLPRKAPTAATRAIERHCHSTDHRTHLADLDELSPRADLVHVDALVLH